LFNGELDPFALFQTLESTPSNGRIVDENILALVGRDESIAFGAAEPFDNAGLPLSFHNFSPFINCHNLFSTEVAQDYPDLKEKPSGMESLDGLV